MDAARERSFNDVPFDKLLDRVRNCKRGDNRLAHFLDAYCIALEVRRSAAETSAPQCRGDVSSVVTKETHMWMRLCVCGSRSPLRAR